MKRILSSLLLAALSIVLVAGCSTSASDPVQCSNTSLSALAVSAGTLSSTFSAETTAYTVSVPFATTAITVTGTASDEKATLSANNGVAQPLNVGDNVITIRVTAQDGTTKDYVVTVMRLSLLTMVSVPAGSFQRDASATNISTITNAYKMSTCEITRAQFLEIMGTDPSTTTCSSGMNDPVQMVNWYHAIAFCNKLSIAEGLARVYDVFGFDDDAAWAALSYAAIPKANDATWNEVIATWTNNGYRLPTDMEWMWAAIGATSDSRSVDMAGGVNTGGYTKGYAGSTEAGSAQVNIENYVWYTYNSGLKTHPVGTAGSTGHPNELGLYDMTGNVSEWNWDWYAGYPSGPLVSDAIDGSGRGAASALCRGVRGGGFVSIASSCEVDFRNYGNPGDQYDYIGFRVVRP